MLCLELLGKKRRGRQKTNEVHGCSKRGHASGWSVIQRAGEIGDCRFAETAMTLFLMGATKRKKKEKTNSLVGFYYTNATIDVPVYMSTYASHAKRSVNLCSCQKTPPRLCHE